MSTVHSPSFRCHPRLSSRAAVSLPALALLSLSTVSGFAGEDILRLNIGDPLRRERTTEVVLDAIQDTEKGDLLCPSDLPARLADTRFLLVGESHTSAEFHRVQLRVLEELERSGRPILIGLEMFPQTQQKFLDQWIGGLLTEEGFVELAQWYKNWGYNWNYYRDIFDFARSHKIPMFGVNTPRSVVTAVGSKGFEQLTQEEAAYLPPRIDTGSAEHFQLFKTYLEGEGGFHSSVSDEQWKKMFEAQCTWDAAMAFNSVKQLEEHSADAILVLLVGSGHVSYGLGIQRQAALWFEGRTASLIPVESSVADVQASYADFVWGIPAEAFPFFPELGITTSGAGEDGPAVIFVDEESVASRAGFKVHDVVQKIDGIDIPDRATMNRLLAAKRWGDSTVIEVLREEEHLTLRAFFRRSR